MISKLGNFPNAKNKHKHFCIQRGWELLQEKERKGEKKLNFTQEIVLGTGTVSPTCS